MRILITGVKSKISFYLIPLLIGKGHQPVGISRTIANYDNRHGIDVLNVDLLEEIPGLGEFDAIVHLASKVPYNDSDKVEDESCFRDNINMTNNLLRFQQKHKIKRLVYASSVDVYKQSETDITEKSEVDPSSYYSLSKYSSEKLCNTYSQLYDLELVILRISPVFGPGMSGNLFIHQLLESLRTKESVDLYAPDSIHNLLYTEDVALALCASLSGKPGLYNIAGNPVSLREFVGLVAEVLGKSISINQLPGNRTDGERLYDVSRANKYLAWAPKLSLYDGIKSYYNY